MKKTLTTIISVLLLSCLTIKAEEYRFARISTNKGLSHYTVHSLYEDEFGTVWAATPMGLNRCTGSQVTVYANDMKDPHSLSCDWVLKVTGNRDGLVYILTKQSFEVLDLRLDRIVKCIPFNGSIHINDIFWKDGLYVCCGNSDIVRWNDDKGTFEDVFHINEKTELCSVFVDDSGNIWAASLNTLYRISSDLSEEKIVSRDICVHDMSQDNNERIFVSTFNDGIFVCDDDGKILRHISVSDGLASGFVRKVCQDSYGTYWVGTEKGLNILTPNLEISSLYVADGQYGSISNSSIYDIICDSYGNTWIATYFGGLNLYNPDRENYHVLKAFPDGKGLSSSLVSCITEGSGGDIWIGTVDGGLNRYNTLTHEVSWFRYDKSGNSISGDNVKTLYYDDARDALWIGTHNHGFCRLDISKSAFVDYIIPDGGNSPAANIVSGIIPYGDALVLTTYRGIYLFSPDSGRFEKLLDLPYIRSAFLDSKSGLWMGTTSGQLFNYNMKTGKLQSYGTVLREQNNGRMSIIYDITEDGDGNLWMASFGGGLKKYDVSDRKFSTMNTLNSAIPTDNLLAAKYCGDGKIIMTGHNAYMTYDIESGRFETRNRDYGLPVYYIMENSLYCSADGKTVYVGTNGGLLSFHRIGSGASHAALPVIFSRLWVNGEEVRPGDSTGILENSMMYVDELVLNHNQNSFAVEFFQPEYHYDRPQQLMYCLDSDLNKWHKLPPGETTLRFYNQAPGKFRILIKNQEDTDGNFMETSLVIRVKPPFYRTTAAYISYAVIFFLLLAGVIHTLTSKLKEKERQHYDEKESHYKKAHALSKQQAKLQFFFAISHEFSTPLTIIMGQMELLLMKYDFIPAVRKKLDSIYKNALQLHDLLFELLEFRKHEMGQMKLKVAEYDICTIAEESFLLYMEYSRSRDIEYTLETNPGHIMVWCDRKQMQKVFNNLLSNAFKYTEAGGRVTMSVCRLDHEICIRVSDNGCGIDNEDVEHIFTEFYQGKQSSDIPGVGIGLHLVKNITDLHKGRVEVRSELNKGTSFFVYLKLGNGHFSLEELSARPFIDTSFLPKKPSPVTMAETGTSEEKEGQPAEKERYTMLITEDDNALREMIANIFSQYYNVIQAVDGKDGWNKLMQHDVDIVVSDIIMPNMTGTEFCQKIKDSLETCHIPVVLLSVRADIQNCIDGFNARADDYIIKPFSVRLLMSRCENLLKNRNLLQKKFRQSPGTDVEVLTSNALDKEFTEKLVKLIEENIDNSELNIAFLQKEMFVSRTTLFQKLKALTGQTPMEFISSIRLKKAAELLLTRPDLSVSAVSDAVGFGSAKYFSRIFKETYHIRPLDYRNGKNAGSGE